MFGNELKEKVDKLHDRMMELENENTQLKKHIAKIEMLQQSFIGFQKEYTHYTEDLDKKRSKSDPWVQLVGDGYDADKGLKLELDWNPSFVSMLRKCGYDGPEDEEVVRKWLAAMYNDVLLTMEEDAYQ